ncbi:synaptotagmin-4-like [Gossypium australe]|uniref:Synaptotagmin-4-like n=1 Tax=Gossypium australe TaxID=47621 RepID=A0A5B6VRX8_9ROSI|nr:synaptotagmin-4-like [Gossypium australe]
MGLVSGMFMGMVFGISLMAGWRHMMKYRSTKRIAKGGYKKLFECFVAADIKVLGALSRDDLKKICGDNYPEWISFPVYEQVKWLNKHLSKLWPFVAEAASAVIKESVEPLLEEYRPPGITSLKFSKLSLGTVAPKIEAYSSHISLLSKVLDLNLLWRVSWSCLRDLFTAQFDFQSSVNYCEFLALSISTSMFAYAMQSLKKGQITMDIDLRWGGDPSIILGVEAALVASIPIQLKNLQVFTVVRVIFQLAEEIPCISAAVVALLAEVLIHCCKCNGVYIVLLRNVEIRNNAIYNCFEITDSFCKLNQPKPRIDYTLKAVGGSLTAVPGISDMIDDTVNSIVTDMLQWPHRIVVPIGGIPVDTSELELKPEGKLTVTVVKANDLKNMEMIGKSDPYVVVHIRPLFKIKTKVVENNLNPIWNETFELIAEDRETQELTVEVFDQDIGQDKRLGIAKFRLIELEPETPKEVNLNLLSSLDTLKIKDNKDRGSCTIKLLYHQFNKEEQLIALEEEKRILEERKRLKEAGVIGSTMDALDGAASLVGTGIGTGVGLVGSGVSAGVGMVGSGLGAVGSGLSKAGKFMGRTVTGHSSKKSETTTTPDESKEENGGAKPQ